MKLELFGAPVHPNITIQEFKDAAVEATEKHFVSIPNFQTMVMLLPQAKDQMIFAFPDMENKDAAAISIRVLCEHLNCIAIAWVTEGWSTEIPRGEVDQLRLLHDLDYRVSLMSNRKEILNLYFEYKHEGKRIKQDTLWDVLRNPTRIINRKETEGGEGRLTDFLIF